MKKILTIILMIPCLVYSSDNCHKFPEMRTGKIQGMVVKDGDKRWTCYNEYTARDIDKKLIELKHLRIERKKVIPVAKEKEIELKQEHFWDKLKSSAYGIAAGFILGALTVMAVKK